MSDGLSVEIVGEARLAQLFEQLQATGKPAHVRNALYAGAQVYRKEIMARAPEGTGFLKKAVSAWRVPKRHAGNPDVPEARAGVVRNVFRKGKYRVALTGRIGSNKHRRFVRVNAFYARYVEEGTSKMAAKPFFRPAADAARGAAFAAVEKNILKSLTKLQGQA